MNFIKKYKEKQDTERKLKRNRYLAKKELSKKILLKANKSMFNKLCPLNNLDNCFPECVHFKKGIVFDFLEDNVGYIPPRCKLWVINERW